MFYTHFRRLAVLAPFVLTVAACSTVDFSQPEIPLAERFRDGAQVRLAGFSGGASLGASAEGPSLDILHDQLTYGAVRCSRPGPAVDLDVAADFTDRGGPQRNAQRLIGVATWRDPATREVVGRHHLDVAVDVDWRDRTRVNISEDDDGFGTEVPRGQLAAGEAFIGQLCEKAFGGD